MLAVVINPLICQSPWWFLIAECWGVIPMVGAALSAILAAVAVRRVRVLAR